MGKELLSSLLVLLALGCSYPTAEPERELVVGRWTISLESLDVLEEAGYQRVDKADHHIVLRSTGDCEFRSYWIYSSARAAQREDDYYVLRKPADGTQAARDLTWRERVAHCVAVCGSKSRRMRSRALASH